MDAVKMAIINISSLVGTRELIRLRKEANKEKNIIIKATLNRHIKDLEVSLEMIDSEIFKVKTVGLPETETKVGSTD